MSHFSIVVPWRNRPEIAQMLAANAPWFEAHDAEVIVVNCGGDQELLSRAMHGAPISRLRHVLMPETPFNRSLANNIGAYYSSGERLFFLDADVTLRSDVLRQARRKLEDGGCFLQIRKVDETQPRPDDHIRCLTAMVSTQHLLFKDGRRARLCSRHGSDGSRDGPGLLLIDRAHLLAVGGFNSGLRGWGFDDRDVQIRLQVMLGLSLRRTGAVLHMSHGDERRATTNGSSGEDARRNRQYCFDAYERGQFLGSYEDDVCAWRERMREIPRG